MQLSYLQTGEHSSLSPYFSSQIGQMKSNFFLESSLGSELFLELSPGLESGSLVTVGVSSTHFVGYSSLLTVFGILPVPHVEHVPPIVFTYFV